jgi:hypothetical protein
MSKNREWDYEEDYRDFKRPKKVEKDKFGKHRKAIYDLLEDDEGDDEEYGDDVHYEFDEE